MLNTIKTKFKNAKKKIDINNGKLSLKKLSPNAFPYSCLVADDVMLTKNGEVFSMIEIILDDFKKNQEGGLRDAIRKAISENTNDLKTAFWIQTVKRKIKKEKTEEQQKDINLFLKKVYEVSQSIEEKLNNYETIIYITIIRQGKSFKIGQSSLQDYFSNSFLANKHNKYLDENIQRVKEITSNIANILSQYNPKILKTRILNECEYSEIIEKLYFLVNFEDKPQKVDIVDATDLINNSSYFFENGIMAIKNNDSDKIKLGMSFSLKEIPNISMTNVSDIINNTRAEMIITEYVSYIDQKYAISNFKDQKELLEKKIDKEFQEKVGLSFLDKANTKYCQSSLSIFVLAGNIKELNSFVSDCTKMFSKHGIVMAREDISLERNYFAMMPANFSFIHRMTIHDAKEVGCFSYSYRPKQNNTENFLNNTILFNIGTLKGNPVPIGFDKNKTNTLIVGNNNTGKAVLSNFLASSYMRNNDTNLFIIEFKNKSSTLLDAIGGKSYTVSLDRQRHTARFNGINTNIFDTQEEKENYIFEMFSLFLSNINIVITQDIANEIRQIAQYIIEKQNTLKQPIALHDIRDILKGKDIDNELQSWHSIGRYYYFFDNRDDVFLENNLLRLFIDDTIKNNSLLLTTIIYHIFSNILQLAKKSNKQTIVVLDEPFLAFGNSYFKVKMKKLLKDMSKNNIHCIFRISDIEKEHTTIVDFSCLTQSCGLQIHFANQYADSDYGRIFGLEKLDYMSIKALSGYEGRNILVKYPQYVYTCEFDIKQYPKTLNLLSDKEETKMKILQIKEALRSDDSERWLSAYYNDFNANIDSDESLELQKELQAIKDVRKLLES